MAHTVPGPIVSGKGDSVCALQIPHKQTSLVLSYLTSLLAEHATAMYGNIHSAYYGELAKRFAAADKPAHHLNPDCPETGICS